MKSSVLAKWSWIHKWSSLVCTVFLLMLCLTGLPLIFHDEIDGLLNPDTWEPESPEARFLDLDAILSRALDNRPNEVPIYMSFDIERPVVNVTTGASPDVPAPRMHFASFDLTSGKLVPPADVGKGFMDFILRLHTDVFLNLPGMLFLGGMGVLFLVATVSGAVLYAPFMSKLEFGTVRRYRSRKLKWLDYHNLIGIVTLAWVAVVGLTGVINTLESPIIDTWRSTELNDLIAMNSDVKTTVQRASVDAAVNKAVSAMPEMRLQFVAFPGSEYSTESHYAIFLQGKTPLTQHLMAPVLINASSGLVDGIREMPLYAKALSLSRPLHFGDYGGLPLKLVWAILDLLTIAVLVTGLYLWAKKRGGATSSSRNKPLDEQWVQSD